MLFLPVRMIEVVIRHSRMNVPSFIVKSLNTFRPTFTAEYFNTGVIQV